MDQPMMTLLLAALSVQAQPEPPRSPFRARLTVERFVKREDGVDAQTGTLCVRPGEALSFEARGSRLLIRDGVAIERRAGERSARRWTLSKPENFQPADVWRLDLPAIRALFEVHTDRPQETREPPASVVTAEGKAVPAVVVKPGGAIVVAEGVDRAEGCSRVLLYPRDPALRARMTSIRLSVERATGLILRAVVDSPALQLTLTLSDYREVASLEDAAFEMDLSNLKVEER
jgi:hypothetical protein